MCKVLNKRDNLTLRSVCCMQLEGQLVKASSNRQFLDGQLTDLQCRLKSTEQSKQDALAHVER